MQFSISSKSFFRQLASRSVRSTRPVAFFRRKGAAGISRLAEISVWKPRYSSILAAATLPASTARITVAGPETQSPPEKTPSQPGTLPSSAVTILLRWVGTPSSAKTAESTAWPTAMRTTSQA